MEDANQPLSDDCDLLGERNSSYRCLTDGSIQINNSVIAISETNVYYNIIMVIPEGNPDVVTPEFSSEVIDDPVIPNPEESGSENESLEFFMILLLFGFIPLLVGLVLQNSINRDKLIHNVIQMIEDNEYIESRNEVYVFSDKFISTCSSEKLWEKWGFRNLLHDLKKPRISLGKQLSNGFF